jgi:hypothetical protein
MPLKILYSDNRFDLEQQFNDWEKNALAMIKDNKFVQMPNGEVIALDLCLAVRTQLVAVSVSEGIFLFLQIFHNCPQH